MSLTTLLRGHRLRNVLRLNVRQFASSEEVKFAEAVPTDLELVEEETDNVDVIEEKRNKSKLFTRHYNKLHGKAPSLSEDELQVFALSRLRRIYGEHGSASGVNVGLLWPSKEELELQKERERIAYPDDIPRMIEIAKRSQEEEEQNILKRQEELSLKVAKLEDWKKEVRDRVKKQENIAREAKEKKERVMDEVRQMFGFRIDPKDDRFKEALEKKEQEEKRAAKAAKRLKKQQKIVAEIQKMAQQAEANKAEDDKSGEFSQGADVQATTQPPQETPATTQPPQETPATTQPPQETKS